MKNAAKNKKHSKLLWLLVIPVVLIAFIAIYIFQNSGFGVDKNNPAKFVTADFVDLSKVYSISKFRSLSGHDFSGGGESCRSMKHYFEPQEDAATHNYMMAHNFTPIPPNGKDDSPIYSPVDGTIVKIKSENSKTGKQIFIVPSNAKGYAIRLFHVYPKEGLHAGKLGTGLGASHVKAGEQIGVIGAHQTTDVSVQIGNMPWDQAYVSYFDVMQDSVFAKYQARGVNSRADLVLTKAFRDAHPASCSQNGNEQFNLPTNYDYDQDYVRLSGYQKLNYSN